MRIWVGVTDNDWFHFLASSRPGEVNFWRPSERNVFRALSPGEPFLFKLHAPDHFIAGGGFFVQYIVLPLSFLWRIYGERNGAPNEEALRAKIQRYRARQGLPPARDPEVGTVLLTEPFFWPREAWLRLPPDWPASGARQGKGYATNDPVGARLWADVVERLRLEPRFADLGALSLREPAERVRTFALRRLHQGAFRALVTEAYGRRCAVTGEHTLPVLEAAHIVPVASNGPNDVRNGILLRADVHILFDLGYVTFDEGGRFVVSPRLSSEFANGRVYYAHAGTPMAIPEDRSQRPSPDYLAFHREHVFIA